MKEKFVSLLLCAVLLVMGGIGNVEAYSESSTGTTEVSMVCDSESKYDLVINVGFGGKVIYDSQTLNEGTYYYKVPLDTTNRFTVVPNYNYKTSGVRYEKPEWSEKKDLTDMVQHQGTFSVDTENTKMVFNFTFEKKDETVNKSEAVKTGDVLTGKVYFVLLVASLGAYLYLKKN